MTDPLLDFDKGDRIVAIDFNDMEQRVLARLSTITGRFKMKTEDDIPENVVIQSLPRHEDDLMLKMFEREDELWLGMDIGAPADPVVWADDYPDSWFRKNHMCEFPEPEERPDPFAKGTPMHQHRNRPVAEHPRGYRK
jgi:hypothetical protein